MSEFRTPLGESVFQSKYAHEGAETWEKLARLVVEDVCQDRLSRDDKDQLAAYIRDFKFIPGGRYLYYAGRENKFFNNCLTGDNQVLTPDGWRYLDSFGEDDPVDIWSPVEQDFLKTTIHYHGHQPIQKITFRYPSGRSTLEKVVYATPDHKWMTTRGPTEDLQVGDVVPAAISGSGWDTDPSGFLHGAVFADGNKHPLKSGVAHQLRLCGDKGKYRPICEQAGMTFSEPSFAEGDSVGYINSPVDLKELPDTDDLEYLVSFIRAWVAFDGHNNRQLHTTDREALEWFVAHAPIAGLYPVGDIRTDTKPSNYGPRKSLHSVKFRTYEDFRGWKVSSISPAGTANVYCPFEPKHNRITIQGGMDTFNCFLLKAEEDTREDWAALTYRATSCLMTGGGIGIDYSVYRPKGALIRRTGGQASGPIPAMEMVNELGRRVMQGGSRRSAIYASLNWQHGDVEEFLKIKNWHDQKIAGTDTTVGEVKEQDFDFHAPLDYTNISVNYDDAWLNKPDRHLDPVFLANVRQALSTAEPGMSFNFGDKQNETLRNACCEVTSEDDSDVCNLGSVNMARIHDLQEFKDVVELATKFLVCGTLRADLPYEKVHAVREKNRRLGLGLMGMHEWLLQRGEDYDFTEDMRIWLAHYAFESQYTAKTFADQLGISHPVAQRAIAPTGSIGILAGTTTGIEPVYTVAYKRRYRKNNVWHYQMMIDPTAEAIVQETGCDPDTLDTALSMAEDPERRIKFQADVQDFVDQAISSTLNLPAWGSEKNNACRVESFAKILSSYAPRLRGFTCYPDGARGGQPLVPISYSEAKANPGEYIEEAVDVCDATGKGGTCGI